MKTTFHKAAQKGFTLIELIITIVIIGILAAVAIPKFLDLSTDAKTSVAQGVAAALASATSVNYAKSQTPSGGAVTIGAGGTDCAANSALILGLADVPAGTTVTGAAVLQQNGTSVLCTVTVNGGTATFQAYGAP